MSAPIISFLASADTAMTDQKRILFTGGSGLLGGEVKKKLPDALFPSRSEFDVCNLHLMEEYVSERQIATILHAAAFTSPPKVDKQPETAVDVNIIGTANVVKLCIRHNFRLVYVSTDYVFKGDRGNYSEDDPVYPVNKYAWSKLGGECAVRLLDDSAVIRTSFGPNEFPYDKAFVDQWTSRETVSSVTDMILQVVDSEFRGTIHIGGKRRTVYEYAKMSSPEKQVGELHAGEVAFVVPRDTSLNTELFQRLFSNKRGNH